MAFLTEEEFRELNVAESSTSIATTKVAACLQAAIDILNGLCGEAAVNEVAGASNTDSLKVRNFRRAQEKLALRELTHYQSSRWRDGGFKVSEKDLNDSAQDTFEGFDKTKARRQELYDEAVKAISSYLTTEETAAAVSDLHYSQNIPVAFEW